MVYWIIVGTVWVISMIFLFLAGFFFAKLSIQGFSPGSL